MQRVPAEVRREMRPQRLYKVRVLSVREAGDLGGVRAMVEASNMYVKDARGSFVPVLNLSSHNVTSKVSYAPP